MVLSTDVSVVEHTLNAARGTLFRIPANAMQLKGHTGLLLPTAAAGKQDERRKKTESVFPSGVRCPLKCNYYRTTTPFATTTTCSRR